MWRFCTVVLHIEAHLFHPSGGAPSQKPPQMLLVLRRVMACVHLWRTVAWASGCLGSAEVWSTDNLVVSAATLTVQIVICGTRVAFWLRLSNGASIHTRDCHKIRFLYNGWLIKTLVNWARTKTGKSVFLWHYFIWVTLPPLRSDVLLGCGNTSSLESHLLPLCDSVLLSIPVHSFLPSIYPQNHHFSTFLQLYWPVNCNKVIKAWRSVELQQVHN